MIVAFYIIAIVAVLAIVFAIFKQIDWYAFFNKIYGDNPHKARVFVQYGEHEFGCDGEYQFQDDQWIYFEYEYDKHKFTVAVPVSYDYRYIRGRRRINVQYGNEYALPITRKDNIVAGALMIRAQKGAQLLNTSINKKLVVDLVNSIESRNKFGLSAIILIVVVLVAGYLIYTQFFKHPATPPVSNNVTANQTITTTNPYEIVTTTTTPYIINQ